MCTRSKPWFDTELLGCVAWKLEIPQAFQVLLILKLNNSDPEFVQKEIVENKTSNIKLNKLEIRYRMSIDSFSQNYTLCVSPSDSMYITYILYIYFMYTYVYTISHFHHSQSSTDPEMGCAECRYPTWYYQEYQKIGQGNCHLIDKNRHPDGRWRTC